LADIAVPSLGCPGKHLRTFKDINGLTPAVSDLVGLKLGIKKVLNSPRYSSMQATLGTTGLKTVCSARSFYNFRHVPHETWKGAVMIRG
jgi:hypothetical protein